MEHHRPTAGEPANPNASDDARKLLKFRYHLKRNSWSGGVIPRQQIGIPVDAVDNTTEVARYALLSKAFRGTGKWPGLVGLDYESGQDFIVDETKAPSKGVKSYWNPRDEYVDTVAGTCYTECSKDMVTQPR